MNRKFGFILIAFLFGITFLLLTRSVWSQAGGTIAIDQAVVNYDRYELTLTNDQGFYWQGELPAGKQPQIGLTLPDGTKLTDGNYQYELRYIATPSTYAAQIMAESIDAPNRAEIEADLIAGGHLALPQVETGIFVIKNGGLASINANNTLSPTHGDQDETGPAPLDIIHADDVIINGGSLCVGLDCVNGEAFGFDTIRIKENNLRIHFDDTSASASFPANDWRIVINDSTNGGASYFAIEDSTAGRVPFKVQAGAPVNSLLVESTGDIGIGTANPVLELHIADGDTPSIRLEQNGSSGFGLQTWDMAGNESNFFVRDVTNGSRLPFKIKPSAPTDSLFVNTNGNIGLSTSSPDSELHIRRTTALTVTMSIENNVNRWDISNAGDTLTIGTEAGTQTVPFALDDNGNLVLGGALTEASDVNRKENFAPVNQRSILEGIANLPLQSWNYIGDSAKVRHLGPMAQDFYAAFGLGIDERHIAPLDANGILFAGMQELIQVDAGIAWEMNRLQARNQYLSRQISAMQADIDLLQAENEDLNKRLTELEALVNQLLENQAEK